VFSKTASGQGGGGVREGRTKTSRGGKPIEYPSGEGPQRSARIRLDSGRSRGQIRKSAAFPEFREEQKGGAYKFGKRAFNESRGWGRIGDIKDQRGKR